MGAQPAQTPEQAELSGTSVRAADTSCLNAPVTSDELHDCIKRLKRSKSAGIDIILSEMIKDDGEVLHSCLLVIFSLMLVIHFPKQLSVGLITAVCKSGNKVTCPCAYTYVQVLGHVFEAQALAMSVRPVSVRLLAACSANGDAV